MTILHRICLIPLLFLLVLTGTPALAAEDDDAPWAPTPPRLGFIDGEVSYWRPGAEDWVRAQLNLALAEGDALYSGSDANFEVQYGSRSFVRADADTQLSLVAQEEQRIQFKLTSGRVSFDMRSIAVGDTLEVSTPNAVFVVAHPGYYRVEVNSRDTHFITRRGGEATVTTADGRALSIYPSEDIVVSAGDPVRVATYAAPAPDAWDRWNDARSDRSGESISARYLPPDVYGAEELDRYGRWRVVPSYGPVWIPDGVGADWVPYSTGSWVWDPYYEWTWIDAAPWGWAPFHYGRWVDIGGYWAWAPGPVVRRSVYSPALVAFMIRDHNVSVQIGAGLPGMGWVALSWGEPLLPWWGPPRHRGHPWWGGWGGPRVVNNVVIKPTTIIKTGDIHFHNARLPGAIRTMPADRFGRERVRAATGNRYAPADFVPVRGELPVRPTRASLFGGAPRGAPPPRDVVARPVVSTRIPREREQAVRWQDGAIRSRDVDASRYVVPPPRRSEGARTLPRPPFGADAGPERTPPPAPPRYGEVRRSIPATPPPLTTRSQSPARERAAVPPLRPQTSPRRGALPAPPSARPPATGGMQVPRTRSESAAPRDEARPERTSRPLPGQPANQTYRGRDRDFRDAR